jgi:hypothetical protein
MNHKISKRIIISVSAFTLSLIFLLNVNGQNNSLSFDGSNDYVSVPALGNGFNQFTIETWFNATALASSPGLNGIFNTNSWGSTGDIHYQINNTKIELAVNGNSIASINYSFSLNRWYHLATTYNAVNKQVNFYINGIFIQSVPLSSTVAVNFSASKIGDWNGTRYFSGIFDEYRIWNTERSLYDIRNNMYISLSGNETGLLASFNFNQGTPGGSNTGFTTLNNGTETNNGTLNNFALSGITSNWIASTVPFSNNCLNFNGTTNYVNCGSVNPSKFTIEAWAYPNGSGTDQAIVSTLSETSFTGCELHIASDNYPCVTLRNGSTWLDIKSNKKATAGTWIHMAASFDGSTCRLFINGVQVATQSSISYLAGSSPLVLGRRSSGSLVFAGNIDDVRIWNRVIAGTDLSDSLYTRLYGNEKGLLAYYGFDQGISGGTNTGLTTLYSATGTYNGTLNSFTLSGTTSNWVYGFKQSPTTQATDFSGSLVSNKLTLTWIDATGTVIPDGYLIYASKNNFFISPVDGILPTDDNDLSDGTGVIRVAKGIQTYNGWINENFNTIYYFRIYPFTNPGINIRYNTSGSVPQTQVTSKPLMTQVTSTLPKHSGTSWVDYNNDGYLDLMVRLDALEKTTLFRNNQNNTYTAVANFSASGSSFEQNIGWTDFDKNGFLDMTGKTNIYINNNGASFIPVASSSIGLPNLEGEWSDIDKDADLDLLTKAGNGYDIKIYRKDLLVYNELFGNNFRPCDGPVKWIDYNKDGFPDIIASGLNPIDGKRYTTIYLNKGNGKFVEQIQIKLPVLHLGSISIADINSDGFMDILLSGNNTDNSGEVILCTNNNGNSFTYKTIATFYNCLYSEISVTDFTNDGLNDFIVSASTSETESIYKIFSNNGDGTFSEIYNYKPYGVKTDFSLTDINNDGNIDIVEDWETVQQNNTTKTNLRPNKITNATSTIEGNGIIFNWSTTDDNTPSAGLTYELRIGTSSNTSNILAANSISSGTRKMLIPGNMGTSTTQYLQLPKGTYFWSVQAIDNSYKGSLFSDEKTFTIIDVPSSKLEAKKIDNYSLNLKWKKGNGSKRVVFCKIGTSGTAVPVNNKSYIASPNYGEGDQIGSTGWYCVYNGIGDSLEVSNLSNSNSYSFHVIEYTGVQGSENYVLTTSDGNPGVFSTAVFNEQPAISTPENYGFRTDGYFGDFNNDNRLDFLFNQNNNIFITYLNQGNNTFSSFDIPSTRIFTNSLVLVADYNNDGLLDFFEIGDYYVHFMSYPTFTRVFINKGNNTFLEKLFNNETIAGTINSSMALGDYNNDGNLDLFVGGNMATVVPVSEYPYYETTYKRISKVYKNNGPSDEYSFSEQTDIVLPGLSNGASKWGDFNNDGWPDLLITGLDDNNNYNIYLCINNKNNSFTTHQIEYSGPEYIKGYLDCADFDKDGFLDFLFSTDNSATSGNAIIYWNNKNNTFTRDNISFAEQTTHNQFALGDFDNDGAIDVMFMQSGTTFKRLYKNKYPERSFTMVTDFVSPGSVNGSITMGDYDNDGDIDILSTDNGDIPGLCNIIKNSSIMKSGNFPENLLPAAPVNIKTSLTPGQLLITWDKVLTDETPNLSYNIKLEKDGVFINSPNTIQPEGKRLIPEMGNTGLNNFAIFKGLPVGTYSISVQSVDGSFSGGPWSTGFPVEIKDTKAFFTFDTVCYKTANKLSDLSTSTKKIISRQWKYNNITISTDSVSYFVFPKAGIDSVRLVVTDSEGSMDSLTHKIVVRPRPSALFSATTVCLGGTTEFVNNSLQNGAGTLTWKWSYGNGESSTDSVPLNKAYGVAQVYKAKLFVTAANNCTDSLSKDIIVGAIPNATISVNGKTSFCQGDSLTLTVEYNPLFNYQWKLDNNDLTDSNKNTYKVRLNSGAYSVKITNSLASCTSTSDIIPVNITETPVIPIITTDNYQAGKCSGENPVVLSIDQPYDKYNYQWKRNGTPISEAMNNSYQVMLSGDYTVIASSAGCKSESLVKTIVFDEGPKKPTLYIEGTSVWYLACSNDSATNYKWYYNGNLIPYANKYLYVANRQLGQYSVSISNEKGCYTMSDVVTIPTLQTGIEEISPFEKLNIYPNPSNGLVSIEMENQVYGEIQIKIYSQEGKEVVNFGFDKETSHFIKQFDLSGYRKGIYMIKVDLKKYSNTCKIVLN